MLSVFILIIAIGLILEAISLRRDPASLGFDYTISTGITEPGVPFSIHTIVTNKSRLPISYLAINEVFPLATGLPEGMVYQEKHDGLHSNNICRVSGLQRKKLTLNVSIKKRGVHIFRVNSLSFGDFLGFREIYKTITDYREIVVFPDRLDIPSLSEALADFCGDIAAKRYLIRDPILTAGYREYSGREPMKDIHWLQSARRGELMVREYEYNRQLSVNVILCVSGISPLDEKSLDDACAVTRTICEALLGKGIPLSFFTNALLQHSGKRDIWNIEVAVGHITGLLEGLGRVMNYSCSSVDNLLEFARRKNDTDAAFIVVFPKLETRDEDAVNQLRRVTGQDVLVINTHLMSERFVTT